MSIYQLRYDSQMANILPPQQQPDPYLIYLFLLFPYLFFTRYKSNLKILILNKLMALVSFLWTNIMVGNIICPQKWRWLYINKESTPGMTYRSAMFYVGELSTGVMASIMVMNSLPL